MSDINLGERLREIRKQKKYTQQKISNILNIDQGTYSGYETNKHLPDIITLIKIADEYMISLDYLCGRFNITKAS